MAEDKKDPNAPVTLADLEALQNSVNQAVAGFNQATQRRYDSVNPSTYASQFGGMIQPPETLDRIAEARPEEVAEMVRLRREGMQGLTAPQYAVAREQMMSQQGAAEQAAQRQLARQQAISGIRGGAATKQSGRLAQQLAQQRAQQEQQLFLTDVGEKQKGMSAYEQTMGGAVQGEQARRLYNIEQQQREQLARQARELTIAQLSQAQALGERQSQAAEYYAQQMAKAGKGGGGGGCCIILVMSTGALGGIDSAKAQEVITLSKGTEQEQAYLVEKYKGDNSIIEAIGLINDSRAVRDECSAKTKRGYYKFSQLFVPIVAKHPAIVKAGKYALVRPIVAIKTEPKSLKAMIGKAWVAVWNLMGSEKPFIRNNGEIV